MENKTIATAVVTTVAVGAIAATMMLAPITNEQTTVLEPTPTAIVEVVATPTPSVTLTPSATPSPSQTPSVTATPKPTAKAQSATPTPHIATIEDYAIRTTLEDGTVVVTYAPDTPVELLEPLMPQPKPKGVNK
jgi:hypothetical protein